MSTAATEGPDAAVGPPAGTERGRGRVLVLGIGSELRRDDAAGRWVADAVARRDLPGVEARAVHQLTPELAADLDGRRRVVFVDAAVDTVDVAVRHLDVPGPRPGVGGPAGRGPAEPMTHHLDPAGLVALAGRLGWAPRSAAVVSVPVRDLGFGTELDPATAVACEAATAQVARLCRDVLADPWVGAGD